MFREAWEVWNWALFHRLEGILVRDSDGPLEDLNQKQTKGPALPYRGDTLGLTNATFIMVVVGK